MSVFREFPRVDPTAKHTKGPQIDAFRGVRTAAKVPSAKDLCKTAPTSACLLPSVEVTQKAAKRMIFRVFVE